MTYLSRLLHPWVCNDDHPGNDGPWLCNRAARDLESRGVTFPDDPDPAHVYMAGPPSRLRFGPADALGCVLGGLGLAALLALASMVLR